MNVLKKIGNYFPKHQKSDVEKKYKIGKALGTGNFSVVKRCTDRETGIEYAMKIIDKKMVEGKEEMIETEVAILRKVKHKNVISMVEAFDTADKLYLVMDLATGGELFERIVKKGSYTEADASALVRSMLEAIDYLHDLDIIHRDLKPENLLFADESETANLMITDFGLSKMMNDATFLTTACGTPGYVAPEVLKQKGYGKSVDLWSIGVITYILLCGYPPFYDEDQASLFETIIRGKFEFHAEYWGGISASAKDLIKKLLTTDPAKRLTAKQALEHPWVQGADASQTDILKNISSGIQRYSGNRLRAVGKAVIMVNRMKHMAADAQKQQQAQSGN
jgi:calcium/calmodulin-dependent protein kinase I